MPLTRPPLGPRKRGYLDRGPRVGFQSTKRSSPSPLALAFVGGVVGTVLAGLSGTVGEYVQSRGEEERLRQTQQSAIDEEVRQSQREAYLSFIVALSENSRVTTLYDQQIAAGQSPLPTRRLDLPQAVAEADRQLDSAWAQVLLYGSEAAVAAAHEARYGWYALQENVFDSHSPTASVREAAADDLSHVSLRFNEGLGRFVDQAREDVALGPVP